jgi:hypothetical protein
VQLTPLERDVLDWIAAHTDDPALKQQLAHLEVLNREYTGVGSFTKLKVPPDSPRVPYRVLPVSASPWIESPQLEAGGGSVLFFADGRATDLELFANGGSFPEILATWRLINFTAASPPTARADVRRLLE